jgi:hypothetical protein
MKMAQISSQNVSEAQLPKAAATNVVSIDFMFSSVVLEARPVQASHAATEGSRQGARRIRHGPQRGEEEARRFSGRLAS